MPLPWHSTARRLQASTAALEHARARPLARLASGAQCALSYLRAIGREDAPALCVTHCDIIRALVARAIGTGFNRMLEFDCDPASCTTLEIGDGDMRIIALNERFGSDLNSG
jgi:probable phosphoglycerate mutase